MGESFSELSLPITDDSITLSVAMALGISAHANNICMVKIRLIIFFVFFIIVYPKIQYYNSKVQHSLLSAVFQKIHHNFYYCLIY